MWRVVTARSCFQEHTHELNVSAATHAARMSVLTPEATEAIRLWAERGLKPIRILEALRHEHPAVQLTLDDVRNLCRPMVEEFRTNATQVVGMLQDLKESENANVQFECVPSCPVASPVRRPEDSSR